MWTVLSTYLTSYPQRWRVQTLLLTDCWMWLTWLNYQIKSCLHWHFSLLTGYNQVLCNSYVNCCDPCKHRYKVCKPSLVQINRSLRLTQLMKKAWVNLITSSVTRRLIGIRLLNRIMKVRKLRPKLAAPPSIRSKVLDKSEEIQEETHQCWLINVS